MKRAGRLFVLELEQQRYALDVAEVARVVRMVAITPMPAAPAGVLGLVNVQGEVLPVIDLRRCLGHPQRPVALEDVLVIADSGERRVVLAADAVRGVIDGAEHVIVRDPEAGGADFLAGVVTLADGLVMVADLAKIASVCGTVWHVLPAAADAARSERDAAGGSVRRATEGGEPAGEPAATGGRRGRRGTAAAAANPDGADAALVRARILAERAAKLGREPAAADGGKRLEIVEFLLADERYALETGFIREVYPLRELTPLPGTPPFVLGIVNLRGRILSVIDLRKFFELPDQGLTDLNKVIILEGAAMEFGVLADAIVGVRSVPERELQPALATLTDLRGDYLKGVTRERLVVLDAARMLADRRIVVHEEA